MQNDEFAAWSLALQIVTYINLLGIGLQTATAREIAQASENGNQIRMQNIVQAAQSIARFSTIGGLIFVLILVVAYPLIFPDIPEAIVPVFRLALLLIGISTAIQLLALVPMGVFQGLHRNNIFVIVQIFVRLITILSLWFSTKLDFQLLGFSIIFSASSIILYPAMKVVSYKLLPWHKKIRSIDKKVRRELLIYCSTLSVWSISMLLVNSVGIVMIGRVAYQMSGAYSIAMSAASILAGLLGAIFSPLLTTAASMHASLEQREKLPNLLLRSTFICGLVLHFLFFLIYLCHRQIISIWVGDSYIETVSQPLLILVGSHALRNLISPYAMMLLATGLQKMALMSGLLEGLGNLVATIFLGLEFGIVGIACGTLFGALVGFLIALIKNTRNTPELTPKPLLFIVIGFLMPVIFVIPFYLMVIDLSFIQIIEGFDFSGFFNGLV